MIKYRDIDLALAVPGIKIEDIRVNPIQVSPLARARAILGGEEFIRSRDETRTITVNFAILEEDRAKRAYMLEALQNWAFTTKPEKMVLPYRDGRAIDVLCTHFPEPSLRQWWESKLSMTFTAFEPYFYDQIEHSTSCGTEFTIGGTAPPLMKITRTLSSKKTNQSYSDGTNTMTFSEIRAGSMVIDLNHQTARVGSYNLMPYYNFGSSFIVPRTGTMTITGTGSIKYIERWR